MKTLATINFKGGVGKTTITWCLGDLLSDYSDFLVLLIDLDAQASLTQSVEFGQESTEFTDWLANSEQTGQTLHAALTEFLGNDGKFDFQPDDDFIYKINEKYHFIPATSDLYWVGMDKFDPERGRAFVERLLGKIANAPSFPQYDYVIFDCPPSFTPLSYSVLTYCDLVLVPVNPDFFATKGVKLFASGMAKQIMPGRLPTTAVFANRVWAKRYSVDGSFENLWIRREDRRRIDRIQEACEDAQKGKLDIRLLESWLPGYKSIGSAITDRRIPSEFRPHLIKLWNEIAEVLS